ncbi:hypothetical protein AT575_09560 [Streptococcus penaeicida]|uniref:Uncharacterized protein n=1 Tax=Streptococcus penaeicida TaxID=1765960 RepID=A0A2N8LA36_9STRE|nr:hypothetical protein [Streptococcus penaeicida]PND47021.1 hypothetical protein AT575_09560 [Streptococcus penaeicida]
MLQFIKTNKKYLIWLFLFGLAGVVIPPIFHYLVKFMNAYPRLSRLIVIGLILVVMIYSPQHIMINLLLLVSITYDLATVKK